MSETSWITLDERSIVAAYLSNGDIARAMETVAQMAGNGPLSVPFAQWLREQSEGWAQRGWFDALWQLYELIAPVVPDGYKLTVGLAYRAQLFGFDAKAQEYGLKTLALRPGDPYAMLILCQLLMKHTQFKQGRDYYECRFDARGEFDAQDWRGFPVKRWAGEALSGKRIYLWTEQGLGDVVMFAGFLPWVLAQQPAHVTLGVAPRMVALLQRAFPEIQVESNGRAFSQASAAILRHNPESSDTLLNLKVMLPEAQDGAFDVAGPIGDLMVYGVDNYIPGQHSAYLQANAARVMVLKREMGMDEAGVRHIGISWHSSNLQNGFVRSIPLAAWAGVLAQPHCRFYSLQHDFKTTEIAQFCEIKGVEIIHPPFEVTQDIDGLAAWIACMDEVITVDNSNAHLAGALGVKTTLLLPVGCNFRWPVVEGGGTLWYASVSTLRQQVNFDWAPVMEQVAKALATPLT